MVEQFTGYKASNGATFDTEQLAWREELLVFLKNNGADNVAIAASIVNTVAGDFVKLDQLRTIVNTLHGLAAPEAGIPAPVQQDDSRPLNCRFRLMDEGKPYPRSRCGGCQRTIMSGLGAKCIHTQRTTVGIDHAL